ncbi:prefoldin subunit beta [Candidatus Woesearchaeota archaeon]|nr:prefoldin subunit beta [Candidatus Woesearchaeota archaeon]
MTKEQNSQANISQLQILEQNLQSFHAQKQNFQMQLLEVQNALEEMKNAKNAYKIIGNIMVQSETKKLEVELKEKKDMFELRIKTVEKQESKLKETAENLQKEILKSMKK